MKNTIYQMSILLEKYHISLPKGTRKDESREATKYHDERFHALKSSCSKSHAFLVDSEASNHMVTSRESFSSLQNTDSMSIHMGDNIQIQDEGKGSIKLNHGVFRNVFYLQICYMYTK